MRLAHYPHFGFVAMPYFALVAAAEPSNHLMFNFLNAPQHVDARNQGACGPSGLGSRACHHTHSPPPRALTAFQSLLVSCRLPFRRRSLVRSGLSIAPAER